MTPSATIDAFPLPPRTVRRRGGWLFSAGWRVGTLLGLIALICIAGVLCRDALVRFTGTPVTAEVSSKAVVGKSRTYRIEYRYNVDGVWRHDGDQVSRRAYDQVASQSKIPAKTTIFLGHRTAALMLGPETYWRTHGILVFICLIWAIVIPAHFYLAWIAPIVDKRTLSHGIVTAGRVTAMQVTTGRTGGHLVTVAFSGRAATIKTNKDTYDATSPGDEVTVFVHPTRPANIVVYELGDFEIDEEPR